MTPTWASASGKQPPSSPRPDRARAGTVYRTCRRCPCARVGMTTKHWIAAASAGGRATWHPTGWPQHRAADQADRRSRNGATRRSRGREHRHSRGGGYPFPPPPALRPYLYIPPLLRSGQKGSPLAQMPSPRRDQGTDSRQSWPGPAPSRCLESPCPAPFASCAQAGVGACEEPAGGRFTRNTTHYPNLRPRPWLRACLAGHGTGWLADGTKRVRSTFRGREGIVWRGRSWTWPGPWKRVPGRKRGREGDGLGCIRAMVTGTSL